VTDISPVHTDDYSRRNFGDCCLIIVVFGDCRRIWQKLYGDYSRQCGQGHTVILHLVN